MIIKIQCLNSFQRSQFTCNHVVLPNNSGMVKIHFWALPKIDSLSQKRLNMVAYAVQFCMQSFKYPLYTETDIVVGSQMT